MDGERSRAPRDAPSLAGRRLGHYEVLETLGRGGMGVVYRAFDRRLERRVAIKLLEPSRAENRGARRRFEREWRTIAALSHPNICSLLDIGEHEGLPYLVLEHLDGTPLSEELRAGPLPLDVAIETGRQLARALAAAHAWRVVHRDVKPANVMRLRDGSVKLLDFGVAKLLPHHWSIDSAAPTADSDSLTSSGVVVGTTPYMSPEQLRGLPLDGRTDIFSLGAVLYETVTGQRAFPGATAAVVMEAILHDEPAPLERLRPETPAELRRIVLKALAKDRDRRYLSAAELGEDLRRVGAAEPTPFAATRAPPAARRLPYLKSLMAGVAAAVAVLVSQCRPPVAPPPPTLAVEIAAAGGGRAPLLAGVSQALVGTLARIPGINVTSLEPGSVAAAAADPLATARQLGATHLVRSRIDGSAERPRLSLSLTEVGTGAVPWSGVFESPAGGLYAAQQAAAREIARALGQSPSPAALAPGRPPPSEDAMRALARGQSLLDRRDVPGNHALAVRRLEEATQLAPEFALAWATLAAAQRLAFEEFREASWLVAAGRSIQTATRLDPAHPFVRYARARILQSQGEAGEAMAEAERLVAEYPQSDNGRRLLGSLLVEQGRYREGVAELQRAVALRPNYWGNLQALGHAHYQAGRLARAASVYRRAIELQPDHAWAHQMLGTVQHVAGDLEAAEGSYRAAVELGADALAWGNLGVLYFGQDRLDEAAEAFEQAARLAPTLFANHLNLGDVLERLGRREEAREAWARAVEIAGEALRVNPNDAATLAYLAVSEARLGRADDARSHVARALELARTSETPYRAAVAYAALGDLDAGVAALARAVRMGASPEYARDDPDLAPLRGHPGFAAALDVSEENAPADATPAEQGEGR